MDNLLEIWEAALNKNGFRITKPFREVMAEIAASKKPLTPIEIHDKIRKYNPNIGLVTVYRSIEKLEQLNLLDHVHQFNGCQTVFPATELHQHLIICESCGKSTYVKGLDVIQKFHQIAKSAGYQYSGHWLQLSGHCNSCRRMV